MPVRLATPRHAISGVVVGHHDSVMAPSFALDLTHLDAAP
jgi:hypothetical protein